MGWSTIIQFSKQTASVAYFRFDRHLLRKEFFSIVDVLKEKYFFLRSEMMKYFGLIIFHPFRFLKVIVADSFFRF